MGLLLLSHFTPGWNNSTPGGAGMAAPPSALEPRGGCFGRRARRQALSLRALHHLILFLPFGCLAACLSENGLRRLDGVPIQKEALRLWPACPPVRWSAVLKKHAGTN